MSRNSKLYPSYNNVSLAKIDCYPDNPNIAATETEAKIKLQALLDKTTKRIFESNGYAYLGSAQTSSNFELVSKWGADGSSDQSTYKIKFENPSQTDENIFISCLVPLELKATDEEGHCIVIWKNPKPSSSLHCRPIRFKMMKETPDNVKEIISEIEQEIAEL